MPLKGLQLSIARRAADMRALHFGRVTVTEKGSVGEFALHIQCPWRIEGPEGILTGRSDLWEPIDGVGERDWDGWDYDTDGNLQDQRLNTLLGNYDPRTQSSVNSSGLLTVAEIEADDLGGMTVVLSGGYRLVVFPAGSTGEDWRLLQFPERQHLVVAGGTVTESSERSIRERLAQWRTS